MTNQPPRAPSVAEGEVAAIILAAGRGSRMKAKTKNKVAFKLAGEPMIAHTVKHLKQAGITNIIAVVGFKAESVRQALGDGVKYVVQEEQLGTGHAPRYAVPMIPSNVETVLVVYGDDSAFYPPSLFSEMVAKKENLKCDVLFLTIHKDDPTGLGRIVRDYSGKVSRIVEEKNATEEEKELKEINTGFYCFDKKFLVDYIDQIQKNSLTGEYYLTDMIEIALNNNKKVEAYFVKDASIWQGVNNRSDLALAQAKIKL
jgi:bifunctional UDP-N-acetylglucosamine pyrophosphorylase/glucosamine-1-phosphate N-acetyltransferase